ncbi:hypothetical protein BLX24_27945 [Arsenicibacter rosenii]|uniref:Uncharacterized protein n=1 Tax=Arsenicibacter rosenii TaxID=1750698 RepID=A0A1S2VAT8_9BACT|nr:hypothetical protein BLX24_27945 [Arsenicibacter rosenii]
MLFCNVLASSFAQPFSGDWQGQLKSPAQTVAATLRLIPKGQQLGGRLDIASDMYTIAGTITGNKATGTMTYPTDGSTFPFTMQLTGTTLQVNITAFGVGMVGAFTKSTGAGTVTAATSDKLYRDPALIGAWQTSEQYGGGANSGGFYGGNTSTMILNADGSFGDGGSTSYISGSNSSGISQGKGNQVIAQLNAMGAKWFTKGNIFYVRIRQNSTVQDIPSSKYYVENNNALLTDLKTGAKTLYRRVR